MSESANGGEAPRIDLEAWDGIRSNLSLGQRLTGTVVSVPRPGTIGMFVDIEMPVIGFVDVLLLPFDVSRWPAEGVVTDFLIWWMDPKNPQIRLVPAKSIYRREDFDEWSSKNAPRGDPGILSRFRFDS
ncbi:hypothetical protein KO481_31975 [Nocardia sp. NEAU-G5]|uniref:S1 motif domain-containing protein n=1 Tax=Nocardia albiluteola TaxID=2842303 RepID=A0ABS6B749_9NOCA|nr:hypothetical protein [Nocardia albiluteola]MBU3066122.1 hypothetical protein [Nocardia albiluteola]